MTHELKPVTTQVMYVATEQIIPPESFGAKSKTAKSIATLGFCSAITLRETASKTYEIIDGRRRYSDMMAQGATIIPAVVVGKGVNDATAAAMALALNTGRSDSPLDEAYQISRLLGHGFTSDAIARLLGVPKVTVDKRVKMTKLPQEIQRGLQEGKILVAAAEKLANMDAEHHKTAVKIYEKYGELKSSDIDAMRSPRVAAVLKPPTKDDAVATFAAAVITALGAGVSLLEMMNVITNYEGK